MGLKWYCDGCGYTAPVGLVKVEQGQRIECPRKNFQGKRICFSQAVVQPDGYTYVYPHWDKYTLENVRLDKMREEDKVLTKKLESFLSNALNVEHRMYYMEHTDERTYSWPCDELDERPISNDVCYYDHKDNYYNVFGKRVWKLVTLRTKLIKRWKKLWQTLLR